ncbi:MAG: amidohydrolase family protein [Pseudooceanicola atlanticus]
MSAPTTPEVQAGPSSLHAKVDPSRRVLFRGGTVLSMDRAVGDYAVADVLVTGDTIVEVAPRIEAEATVIDASGMIVMPGFCDPHIHCWQGALGRLIPDNTSSWNEESGLDATPHKTRSYQYVLHQVFAPIYRPEDMYIGTLLTLLGAVSGGITTVCDNAHNSRTPDHSDACITALIDAGIRGVHAYGRPRSGEFRHAFPDDVRRLRNEYFASDDSRLRLRMYMLGRDPLDELEQVVKLRQELDLWISFDSGVGTLPLPMLYRDGWFDGRETINHGNFIDAEQRRLIVDHGTQVNVCPRIEAQFRFGHVPYQDWIDSGLKPAISNDDPATYAINMFSEMQCLYAFQRSKVLGDRVGLDQGPPHLATLREMLEAATIRGAENCGMSDIVGSLTPGKQADIILIDTRTPLLTPINNAFCTVAQGATPGDVNSVMIGGRFVKWNGQLIGYDEPRIFQAAETSREELFARAGWPLETIDVTG